MQELILVNEKDEEIGTAGKEEVHTKGLLHRAFSVFIFNDKGEILLQKRADDKYHSGGLWTNACCSHPAPGESINEAATRRIKEELGIVAPLKKLSSFVYKAEFENGLTEYEFDHVLVGVYNGYINFNRTEIIETVFKTMQEVKDDIGANPGKYTVWFGMALSHVEKWWQEHYSK